ncbi:hypothetical protein L6R53_27180 [Myxococcota bacterium]|nr:hypothetical protein [Myxococcota bacterium]
MHRLLLAATLGLGLLVSPTALAAKDIKVYVNGTDAAGMKDFQFTAVDVRIDADGNVWIDAPRYRIAVTKPATTTTAPAAPVAAPVAVAAGQHWLVTQDMGSTGQVIEVLINGTSVREIRSGQAQLILDIGPFLKAGSNVVTFRPVAGSTPAGDALKIHLGEGSNESGTLKMQNPQLSYSRTGADPAEEKSVEYVVK